MAAMQLVQKRNVIVLGRTGAGKSTVANKISGFENFEVKKSAASVTKKVSHTEAEAYDPIQNIKYNFKIIDTVGIFDTKEVANEKILNEIKQYFQDKVPEGINLVLFVFRQGRFTGEERSTFDFIIKNFRRYISDISALIITNCENEDEKERRAFVDDFRSNAGDIASFMGKGIHTVGFPDTTNMKPKKKAAFEEDIEADTNKLRNLVKGAGEMLLGKEMFELNFWEKMRQCSIL